MDHHPNKRSKFGSRLAASSVQVILPNAHNWCFPDPE
ncbi:Uncharacterised protein [Vibrio cholerae]|nr:Uncharacterised protein [Vibrio cholerae]